MTIKFTTPEPEVAKNKLLFEFNDDEVPEYIDYEYVTKLGKSKFVGNLQTNQIQGVYLEPLTLSGFEFIGTYYSSKEQILITAHQRFQQLLALQGQVVKFFFDGFKRNVIIEKLKPRVFNQEHVEFEMILQPHDLIKPVELTTLKKIQIMTIDAEAIPLPDEHKLVIDDVLNEANTNTKTSDIQQNQSIDVQNIKEGQLKQRVKDVQNNIASIAKDARINKDNFSKFTELQRKAKQAEDLYFQNRFTGNPLKDINDAFQKLQIIQKDARDLQDVNLTQIQSTQSFFNKFI